MQKVINFLNTEVQDHHFHHVGRAIALFATVAFLLTSGITVSFAAEGAMLDQQYAHTKNQLHIAAELVDQESENLGYVLMGVQQEFAAFDLQESLEILGYGLDSDDLNPYGL